MKSGFISIVGRTNAGKSSILNSLLEEKVAMVSHKQNATRRKINAIIMHENHQLIFIDTPGLHASSKAMNQLMIDLAIKSIADCDVILFVASIYDDIKDYENFLSLNPKVPHIVLINKVDLVKKEVLLKKLSEYSQFSSHFSAIIPYSAKQKFYKKILLDEMVKYLPEHPYYFDPEFITTTNEKDIYRDFILEAIYENLSDEIPYSTEVKIEKIKELEQIYYINATIITDSNSHKGMILGKDGATIKRIGKEARVKIEKLAQKKVMLKLFVQLEKNWHKNEQNLKKILYDE
ncbi:MULTISPECIES: GTPase Era [unclassified Campylobacter]|uniref:GTPase Era n=1 Tax=Campylobacter lari TaxID=201 RepID=A0A7M1MGF1_CAMLA|nr:MULTISPECIES: GTPase Era [unclassified Campylobacter]EAH4571784.1 GTPase Era [Campylobacter lari]MCR8683043.1 GTPase Era [Campylobacter sp. LMG 17559]MCR8704924.1 GTPase Era [Campylobacter sp. 2352 PW]MCV3349182.1 GTPase Era [Campylobacter sp. RKI_CA19_01127]MCV3355249.1 GTPase Era [Campylobacter sp. RKI_CA19_01128]